VTKAFFEANYMDSARQLRSHEPTVRRRLSAEEVVARVLELLDARELQPGDRLREQDLANRFNVSRGPVREALRMLEAKSIVHIEPMRGATITRLSDEEALDSIEASAVLFGLGCRRASARAQAATVAAISAQVEILAGMVEDGLPKDFFLQTLRTGRAVMAAAASPRLRKLVEDVRFGAPNYFGPLGFTSVALRDEALKTWRNLLHAIESGDGTAAEAMGRKVHDDAMNAALMVVS
jgi:DNA-binding GntR family transcriptional regulator